MLCRNDSKSSFGELRIDKNIVCKLYAPASTKTQALLKEVAITNRDGEEGEEGPIAYYGKMKVSKVYSRFAYIDLHILKLQKGPSQILSKLAIFGT